MPDDYVLAPTTLDEEYNLRDLSRFIEEEVALIDTLDDLE